MVGILILVVILAFVAVIAIRTLRFTPKPQPAVSNETYELDEAAIVDALAKLVRCKTISYNDKTLEDDGEFEKLIEKLHTIYRLTVCLHQIYILQYTRTKMANGHLRQLLSMR